MAIAAVAATGNTASSAGPITPSYTGAAAGDIEIAWAFNSGAATIPTVPSGWSNWPGQSGNTCAGVLVYRFCPSATPSASGTFTNATRLIIARYSGVHGFGNAPGKSNATGTSISYPAPASAVQTAGNSWYIGVAGHRTASNVNVAPSGMTNRYSVGTGPMSALHDTNGGVTGWTTASATVNASSGHESMVWELLADEGAWSAINSSGTSQWLLSTNNKVAQSLVNPANTNCIRNITSHSTGKWYFLGRILGYGSTSDMVTGLCTASASLTVWPGGANNNGIAFGFNSSGTDNQWINHTATNNSSIYSPAAAVNDYFHFAFDLTNGKCWVKYDSMTDWNNTVGASPDSGTGGFTYTDVVGSDLFIFTGTGNNGSSYAFNTLDTSLRPANASTFAAWDSTVGGNTYNVSISESGSAADTVSNSATVIGAILEAASAADSPSEIATLLAAIAEVGTAADVQTVQGIYNAAILEAASAADTANGGALFTASITEAGAAADTTSSVATLPAAITEAGAAVDTVSSKATQGVTVSEAGSAVDSPSETAILAAAITEAGSAADTTNSTGIKSATVSEAASAADTTSSTAILAAAVTEAANAQDSETASAPSDLIIVETMNAQDTVSAQVVYRPSVSEAANAQDTTNAGTIIAAVIAEAGSAADVVSALASYAAILAEFAAALDTVSGALAYNAAVVEAANAQDTVSSTEGPVIPPLFNILTGPTRTRILTGPARVRALTGPARVRTLSRG